MYFGEITLLCCMYLLKTSYYTVVHSHSLESTIQQELSIPPGIMSGLLAPSTVVEDTSNAVKRKAIEQAHKGSGYEPHTPLSKPGPEYNILNTRLLHKRVRPVAVKPSTRGRKPKQIPCIEDISVAEPVPVLDIGKRKSDDEDHKGSGYVPHSLPSTPCPQDKSVPPQPTEDNTGMY
jgi:hypothetical protein